MERKILGEQFPTERTTNGQWKCRDISDLMMRPTVAFLAQKLRVGFVSGLKVLGLGDYVCRNLNRHCAGIAVPVDGLFLSIRSDHVALLSSLSATFFGQRLMRKAADLARPLS